MPAYQESVGGIVVSIAAFQARGSSQSEVLCSRVFNLFLCVVDSFWIF